MEEHGEVHSIKGENWIIGRKKNTRIPSIQVAGTNGPASTGKLHRDDRLWSLPVGMAHNLNFWEVKSDWPTWVICLPIFQWEGKDLDY